MTKVYAQNTMTPEIICIETVPQPESSPLRVKARDVSFPLSSEDEALIETLKTMTVHLGGVGLAAPQIGVSKRIAAIYIPEEAAKLREDGQAKAVHVIINPTYEPIEAEGKYLDLEGCYSVKTLMGKVPRAKAICLSYDTEAGERIECVESGFYARVLQHEIDHLNGLLITDRLTPDCPQGSLKAMLELRRQELIAQGKDTTLIDERLKQLKEIGLIEA